MRTEFKYCYRDGNNYKAFGTATLEGVASAESWRAALTALNDDVSFVAEQIDLPPLYSQLYRWSDGPTAADHCWHEYVSYCEVGVSEQLEAVCTVHAFLERLSMVKTWDIRLSPHIDL